MCADVFSVMNTNDKINTSADQRSTEKQTFTPTDEIAISASELIKMIEAGQGDDVNELVQQVLTGRQAA